ncbi:DNA-binding NarL/FixJ family response regulator [Nocardioides sp. BE266]|uniref:response regulator transcription factor n=1 Tax=Nocardioides sp. BE266 TaxID=2817725 RepID=UPI0028616BB7|nr:response regulator transcription factor [Nocardioides sp. BE266]MDR7253182.1 DNA-binding NarL/FixJ family response regulator [Nocardioides sp. BE266]
MTIRVALLGGDEILRRGLDGMLRVLGGFEPVTTQGRDRNPVDIALFETFGVAADDTTLARAVADPYIRRVAVLTWNHHPGLAREVVRNGVVGYLGTSLSAQQLGRALHAIHAGETVVAPTVPAGSPAAADSASDLDRLTARERETLAHIATGRSNVDIAAEMQISLNSVKSYIRSAYAKTGVQSRSQAVLWAVSHGLGAEMLERTALLERASAVACADPGQDGRTQVVRTTVSP